MAEANEDIDVVIEPDKPEGEAPAATAPAEAAKPEEAKAPESGLDKLKAERDAEAQARRDAERRAAEAETRAAEATADSRDNAMALVNNAIERVKVEQAQRKDKLREALAAQDFDAAADLQAQMADDAAAMMRLQEGKADMERKAEEAKKAPKPEVQTTGDPTEDLARQMTPRSAAWVRAHPEFTRDPVKYQRMLAAHNLAVTDGLAPDTDEYFASIEGTLKIAAPVSDDTTARSDAAKPAGGRQTAPPAAPPSRSGDPSVNGRRIVRLTAAQREAAQICGMTETEYAKHLLDIEKEGGAVH